MVANFFHAMTYGQISKFRGTSGTIVKKNENLLQKPSNSVEHWINIWNMDGVVYFEQDFTISIVHLREKISFVVQGVILTMISISITMSHYNRRHCHFED